MTIDRETLPAGTEALPGSDSIRMAPGKPGKRLKSPGFVRNRPESSGFAGKRPESSGIVRNRPETSRIVKVRRGETQNLGGKSSIFNGLPLNPSDGVTVVRTRRKYGDWQHAAELFALGRTPLEVADSLGVPLAKVMRNLRESRRLRRWIGEHCARGHGLQVDWRPPSHALRPVRGRQLTRAKLPVPAAGARRSSAKISRD